MNKTATVFFLLFSFQFIFSQQDNDDEDLIDAGRPNQSETATTAPQWTPHIELGFLYENTVNDEFYKEHYTSHPNVQVRMGILKHTELRLYFEYASSHQEYINEISGTHEINNAAGITPLTMGIKTRFFEGEKLIPSAAFVLSVTFPKMASKVFYSNYTVPGFILVLSHEISNHVAFDYNVGLSRDGESNEWGESFSVSANISLTERLFFFIEHYGFYSHRADADNRFDTGIAYIPYKDVQLDISGGLGLSRVSPNGFIGAGVSIRLPRIGK